MRRGEERREGRRGGEGREEVRRGLSGGGERRRGEGSRGDERRMRKDQECSKHKSIVRNYIIAPFDL